LQWLTILVDGDSARRSDGLQSRRSGRGRSGGARSRGSPPRRGSPVAAAGAPLMLPRQTSRRTRWGSRGISLFLFYRPKENWEFGLILALSSTAIFRACLDPRNFAKFFRFPVTSNLWTHT
jgi:hypothetical protein